MANQTRLISGGTNYYLTGGSVYAGTGHAWDTAGTSPYEIGNNAVTGGPYTPLPSERQEVYGGGAPIHDGAQLLYDTHGNIVETITIQCKATSHDNAVALLRQLRQILSTALTTTPCQLVVQPNTATNAVYFEILGADVKEDPRFMNDEAGNFLKGSGTLRLLVTWRKKPFGGRVSTGESLITAATFTNTNSGANNNTQAFGTGAGDMINEGSPLNVKWSLGVVTVHQIWMASVLERVNSTTNAGAFSTSSTAGVVQFNNSVSLSNQPYANTGVKGRVMIVLSTVNTLTQIQVKVYAAGITGNPLYTSPWITPPASGSANLLDMGWFDMSGLRATNYTASSLNVSVLQRSTTGSSATMTFVSLQVIPYYTWGLVEAINTNFFGEEVRVLSFNERTNAPALAISPPIVSSSTDSTNASSFHLLRGSAPRYYAGASLYVSWVRISYVYNSADAATVTVTHAPQYATLRGGG